jgi:hypothetical protein
MKPNLNKITIHPTFFCLRTRRFGDWILSRIDNVQNVIVINLCNMCNVPITVCVVLCTVFCLSVVCYFLISVFVCRDSL